MRENVPSNSDNSGQPAHFLNLRGGSRMVSEGGGGGGVDLSKLSYFTNSDSQD